MLCWDRSARAVDFYLTIFWARGKDMEFGTCNVFDYALDIGKIKTTFITLTEQKDGQSSGRPRWRAAVGVRLVLRPSPLFAQLLGFATQITIKTQRSRRNKTINRLGWHEIAA